MILKPRLFIKPNLGHPLARGLVGYWLMNEGSGNKVFDLSGNGNTGTFTNSVDLQPGESGPVLHANGVDELVSIPDSPSQRFGG